MNVLFGIVRKKIMEPNNGAHVDPPEAHGRSGGDVIRYNPYKFSRLLRIS